MSLEEPLNVDNSPLFTRNFWGEKHAGFDILSQNLKSACRSTSDFVDFLRESYAVDDNYCKSLTKLARQTASYQTLSTFKPCWAVIHQLVEQIGQLHLSFAQDRQNLIKDVQRYLEEQQKQQKAVKDSEASTQEVVHAFQVSSLQLQKAKVLYHARYAEYQRVVRSESASSREQEKLEVKLKKAQQEYKYSVEKYNNLRNQFVTKMQASCVQFQDIEVAHLENMRKFLVRFGAVWSSARHSLDTISAKFNQDLDQLTTDRLLDTFVKARGTGSNIPAGVSFEDAEVASLFASTDKSTASMESANDLRISSALAACDVDVKDNGQGSEASLNDLSGDSASVSSVPMNGGLNVPSGASGGPSVVASKTLFGSKRRLFKRYRGSPHEPNQEGPIDATADTFTTPRSAGSVSAFNLVARFGSRQLGTASNGKEKLGSTRVDKSEASDWQRDGVPAELPKDEEGFSIPPDPWSNLQNAHSESGNSSSNSDNEAIDVLDRSFKGLKVKIRPPGQLAPNISTLSPEPIVDSKPHGRSSTRTRNLMPVLSDHRGGKPSRPTIDSFAGVNLIQRLPLAPALPPPPSTLTVGENCAAKPNEDLSAIASPQFKQTRRRAKMGFPGSHVELSPTPSAHCPINSPGASESVNGIDNSLPLSVASSHRQDAAILPIVSVDSAGVPSGSTTDMKVESHSDWCVFESDTPGLKRTPEDGKPTWPLSHPVDSTAEQLAQPEPPARAHHRLPSCTSELSFSPLPTSLPSPSFTVDGACTPVSHRTANPVAVAAAFVETWHARFFNGGGSSFSTVATITPPPEQSVTGSLSLAFPTLAVKNLVNQQSQIGGPLVLRLNNSVRIKNLRLELFGSTLSDRPTETTPPTLETPTAFSSTVDYVITIPEPVLTQYLVEQLHNTSETLAKTTLPYVRLTVLTYEVDLGAGLFHRALSPPINLCTYWRCEREMTDFRLDYSTNWPANNFSSLSHEVNGDLRITMTVDGGVTRMQSLPVGVWASQSHQALWKIPLTSTPIVSPNSAPPVSAQPTQNTSGTVRAKFILSNGPGRPQPVALQFVWEECLASGLQLALESSDYRLSLCKRRIVGDHYICDPPSQSSRFQLHPRPLGSSEQTDSSPPLALGPGTETTLLEQT